MTIKPSFQYSTLMLISSLLFMAASFSACKEEEDDPCAGTQLPVLGTCEEVTPTGNLVYIDSTDSYVFTTHGGGKILIDSVFIIQIRHNDYPNFKIEFWGNASQTAEPFNSVYHENLNGKHIKDRIDSTHRTIVFPDGAKITMVTNGATKRLRSVSIYDNGESHVFNVPCNKLEHSITSDECVAKALDDAERDGEAGSFEITETGLLYFNTYTEDVAGEKTENRYNLGEIFRDNPNQVNDWYDDPRLAHT